MGSVAIRAANLAKRYQLGVKLEHNTLRDQLMYGWRSWTARGSRTASDSDFWALKGVSFEVERGEVVGIIGRNGAGKSTLLKILSRITEPTSGTAEIHGRVSSLLEVGTGFHSELSGRENIYLNGAILGMSRTEMAARFDAIVDFAEVSAFIDTPVKRYSSGMYVRLAFAVAAHLESDILLIDEVLAVGDAAFQKKCLGKMGDSAKSGRTVLFVSHNMAALQSLCSRAILLTRGELEMQGSTQGVVQHYLESFSTVDSTPLDERTDRQGDGTARLLSIRVEAVGADNVVRPTSRLKITVEYSSKGPLRYPVFWATIYDYNSSTGLYLLTNEAVGGLPDELPPAGTVTCVTEPINVTPGRCYVNLGVRKGGVIADYVQYATLFDVEMEDVYGLGKIPPRDRVVGLVPHQWSVESRSV